MSPTGESSAGAARLRAADQSERKVAKMRGHHLLSTVAIVGALFATSGASDARAQGALANERWICTDAKSEDQKPALEFVVQKNGLMQESPGPVRYRLLSNTMYGLVAVDYSTDRELGFVDVFVATVMIDKVTGNFITTSSTTGKPPEQHTGRCRMSDGRTAPTVGAAPASK
jgi:hypothetical protein